MSKCIVLTGANTPFSLLALFKGYVEVALGLLSENEAAALILETAELELTDSGIAAAKIVAKLAGFLVRLPYSYLAAESQPCPDRVKLHIRDGSMARCCRAV